MILENFVFILHLDFSLSPIRLSDEGECEAEAAEKHGGYSFLPDVSFSINDSEKSDLFKESERAVKFHSPDVSPITKDRNAPPTFAQSGNKSSFISTSDDVILNKKKTTQ